MGYRSELTATLRDFYRVPDALLNHMDQEARALVETIRIRTARGVAVDGARFEPYAPSTARKKKRTSPVDLTETGQMLGSLRVRNAGSRVRARSIVLSGERNRRLAAIHQFGAQTGRGNIPSRKWFGATASFVERMEQNGIARLRESLPTDKRRSFVIGMRFA